MEKNLVMALGTAIGLVLVLIFLHSYAGIGTEPTEFPGTLPQAGISTPAPAEPARFRVQKRASCRN